MKLKILLPLLTLSLFVIQFASAQDTTGSSIDQKKFDRMMKKKNTIVLDVRTPEEYSAGYIGQAINYNVMDSLNFVNTISSLDKNKKYILYCKSGRRSGKALLLMKNFGFRKVYHLRGGVTNWKGNLKSLDK